MELASRVSEEEIREEIKMYKGRVDALSKKINDEADDELKENVDEFLKVNMLRDGKFMLRIN